jgi:hypothetical protein
MKITKKLVGRITVVAIDEDYKEVSRAHYSVLATTKLMQPYIDEHMAIITKERNGRSNDWVMKQHKERLTTWLKDKNIPNGETADEITIHRLASGPSRQVISWQAYDINGYTYYTHAKDSTCVNQNSGIRIEAINKKNRKVNYFGIIEDIWELDYGMGIQVPLF